MHDDKPTAATQWADLYLEEYQRLAFTSSRIAELRNEVAVLNARVQTAAERLTFDDDPNAFQGQLLRSAHALRPDKP